MKAKQLIRRRDQFGFEFGKRREPGSHVDAAARGGAIRKFQIKSSMASFRRMQAREQVGERRGDRPAQSREAFAGSGFDERAADQ